LALDDILTGVFAFFWMSKVCGEVFCGPGVDASKLIRVNLDTRFSMLDTRTFGSEWFDFDAGAVGESLEGLGEGDVFAHLDEFDDVAAGAAGEALEDLLGGIDVEAGTMVVVEWAQADHFSPLSFERKVFADDINDVVGLLYPRN